MDYIINPDGTASKAGNYPPPPPPPPPPKGPDDNSGLWIIIAIIAIVLFFVFLSTREKGNHQNDDVPFQVDTVTSDMDITRSNLRDRLLPQQTVQQVPASSTESCILQGTVNGDNVTFTLYPSGSNSYTGSFQNHTQGVTWRVRGTVTDNDIRLRSTGLKKNWSFTAYGRGNEYSGSCTNGSITYDMYLFIL